MVSLQSYKSLATEQVNPRTRNLDELSSLEVLKIINKEDASVASAVRRALPSIDRAVKLIVNSIQNEGHLFFMGAGTSGRFGVLEAAECPPTFNTPPSLVRAFMAGGDSSVFRSKEGAEDQRLDAKKIVSKLMSSKDVLVGIAASGITPYVDEALQIANKKNIATVLVTCNPHISKNKATVVISIPTGPEVISGSTRLKAGTATKMVLNMLTVTSMVQVGKVYGNRMVDLQPNSKKLKARAINLISSIGKVSTKIAAHLLEKSGGNSKTAILMALKNITADQAREQLNQTHGKLKKALSL